MGSLSFGAVKFMHMIEGRIFQAKSPGSFQDSPSPVLFLVTPGEASTRWRSATETEISGD